jgi:hypothetical protein
MDENDAWYRVFMDGRWRLEDLYTFPHTFSQCYSFIYCLDSKLEPRDRERIDEAFAGYPWKGGYSYVNIYTVLHYQVPQHFRPVLKAISYASPGWLDILLNPDVAIQVAKSVGILASSGLAAVKAYSAATKYIAQIPVERKRARLEKMRLSQAEQRAFFAICDDLARFLGFKNVKQLHERTGDPEVTSKLLLAHYRRIDRLLEFSKDGKARLPEEVTANQPLQRTGRKPPRR